VKIAVIGPGAIGGLVAGYLKLKGEDVSLIGHAASVQEISRNGLRISGIRGDFNVNIGIAERLNFQPELVILATKTQDIESALQQNLSFLEKSVILSCQNGLQAEKIIGRYLKEENIVSSIVMFGATSLEAGEVVHNFEGSWIVGKLKGKNNGKLACAKEVAGKIFPIVETENIKGMKCLKVFVNANNCIPAILGISMQEAFSEAQVSRIGIAVWKEGLRIVQEAGINLVSLPDFPLERLMKLTSMPIEEAANIYSGIMKGLSREPLYGSILQSIKRNRPSEIDYINGEFVALAKENGIEAGLNEKLVAMVHEVEQKKRFFSKAELIERTEAFITD